MPPRAPRSRPRSSRSPGGAPPADPATIASEIDARLRPAVVPARREFLGAGYAPTGLAWLGVPVPALRRVSRALATETATLPPGALLRLAEAAASDRSIEVRQVGYELLGRRTDALALVTRRVAERLGSGNDNWASVDALATSVTGPAWRLGALTDRDLLVWARHRDPWWRRTALVSTVALNTVSRGGGGDTRRTLLICRAAVDSLTPMLAKALSWALRSLAPHDPRAVRAFVDRYRTALPGGVIREVEMKVKTGRKTPPVTARS